MASRLGHAEMRNLQKLVLKKHVLGIEEIRFSKDRLFGACEAGKMTKAKHPAKTIMTTTRPLELLHMDLFGPPKYSSFGGNMYGLVIIDDFSRYTWVHFLLYKSETPAILKRFAQRVMNNYNLKIKHIRSDKALSSRTSVWKNSSTTWESLMNSLRLTLLSKMELLRGRTEPSSRWLAQCWLSTILHSGGGLKLSTLHAISSIECTFISSSIKHHTS